MNKLVDFFVESKRGRLIRTCDGFYLDLSIRFHVWKQERIWCYGTEERGEQRFADIFSPDPVPVFNWFTSQVAPSFSSRPIWLPSAPEDIRPGWRVLLFEGADLGTLIAPDDRRLELRMRTWGEHYGNLVRLSWIVDADPLTLLESYRDANGYPLLSRFVKEDDA